MGANGSLICEDNEHVFIHHIQIGFGSFTTIKKALNSSDIPDRDVYAPLYHKAVSAFHASTPKNPLLPSKWNLRAYVPRYTYVPRKEEERPECFMVMVCEKSGFTTNAEMLVLSTAAKIDFKSFFQDITGKMGLLYT